MPCSRLRLPQPSSRVLSEVRVGGKRFRFRTVRTLASKRLRVGLSRLHSR